MVASVRSTLVSIRLCFPVCRKYVSGRSNSLATLNNIRLGRISAYFPATTSITYPGSSSGYWTGSVNITHVISRYFSFGWKGWIYFLSFRELMLVSYSVSGWYSTSVPFVSYHHPGIRLPRSSSAARFSSHPFLIATSTISATSFIVHPADAPLYRPTVLYIVPTAAKDTATVQKKYCQLTLDVIVALHESALRPPWRAGRLNRLMCRSRPPTNHVASWRSGDP